MINIPTIDMEFDAFFASFNTGIFKNWLDSNDKLKKQISNIVRTMRMLKIKRL
jgi:hypothetical protein